MKIAWLFVRPGPFVKQWQKDEAAGMKPPKNRADVQARVQKTVLAVGYNPQVLRAAYMSFALPGEITRKKHRKVIKQAQNALGKLKAALRVLARAENANQSVREGLLMKKVGQAFESLNEEELKGVQDGKVDLARLGLSEHRWDTLDRYSRTLDEIEQEFGWCDEAVQQNGKPHFMPNDLLKEWTTALQDLGLGDELTAVALHELGSRGTKDTVRKRRNRGDKTARK